MAFTLPDLPYPYDALAPYMSRETLEFHHDKHHQAYVAAANNLAKGTEWENKPVEEVVKGTFGKNQTLFNNAAQHYNHSHFWKWMKKDGGEKQITSDIGPLAKVKEDLFLDRLVFPFCTFGQVVGGGHVGLVVLVVMELERLARHVWG